MVIPDDKWGFALGAGLKLNAPMVGQGDYFQAQVNYTQGALRYIFQTPNSNWGKVIGANEGFGVATDAVYGGTIANRGRIGPQPDHSVEHQCSLRTFLESTLANLALRRVCRSEVRRSRECNALRGRGIW